jgi:hypothetical protein
MKFHLERAIYDRAPFSKETYRVYDYEAPSLERGYLDLLDYCNGYWDEEELLSDLEENGEPLPKGDDLLDLIVESSINGDGADDIIYLTVDGKVKIDNREAYDLDNIPENELEAWERLGRHIDDEFKKYYL